MSTDPIVKINSLSKRLKDIRAVDNLSLDIYKNDIYGFLGPNGSGKSTTIRMMLSLLTPDKGNIEIFGLPLESNRNKILSRIGSFIEKPDFYEYLSAYKNLEILMEYSGMKPDKYKISETLELVGLGDRSSSTVKTYSNGMKQRLGIAQALLHDPELLILDEPASGLDPTGKKDIRNIISYLNKEKGKTIILSSHNLQEIEMIANRMVIIDKGQKVVEGEVQKLLLEHSYVIRFLVNEPLNALELLNSSKLNIESIERTENNLDIQCKRKEIPGINSYLVKNGIEVISIKVEQNLEDYFLKVI